MKCDNASCEKPGTSRCAACKSVYYCSQPCQKQAWKTHKPTCKDIQFLSTQRDRLPCTLDNGSRKRLSRTLDNLPAGGRQSDNIPNVHVEFKAKYGGETANSKILEKHCLGYKLLKEAPSKIGIVKSFLLSAGTINQLLLKRWGSSKTVELLLFLSEAKPGDIFPNPVFRDKAINHDYLTQMDRVYCLMRNIPVPSITTDIGKAYVSIGFVDLHQIMFSEITDPKLEGCVNWYCYEAGELAFAKSKIILELFKSNLCSEEDILQIWFSSSIGRSAQLALQTICKELVAKECFTDRVKSLYSFWASTGISTKAAHEKWLQTLKGSSMDQIYALDSVTDRAEFAKYVLTGEIFLDPQAKKTVGNVTMFCMPKGFEHFLREHASIFHTLDLKDLAYDHESSLMNSVKNLFLGHAKKMRSFVQNGKAVIQLYHKRIMAQDIETMREIRNLKPAVINWSNLPDYMIPDEFVLMAMMCSYGSATEHHFHLINWMRRVHGSNLIDYLPLDWMDSDPNRPFTDPSGALDKVYKRVCQEFKSNVKKQVSEEMKLLRINEAWGPSGLDSSKAVFARTMLPYFKKEIFGCMNSKRYKSIVLEMRPFSPFAIFSACCGTFELSPDLVAQVQDHFNY